MKNIMFAVLAALMMVACTSEKKAAEKKSLVVYYSVTSTTKKAAECIQQKTGADIVALQAEDPYPTDFQAIVARVQNEREIGALPGVLPLDVDVADYDTIFVGYPIWFGTYAPPLKIWFATTDLKGKVVVPFATFGSGGYKQSVKDLKKAQPEATVLDGFGIRSALMDRLEAQVDDMLIRLGMKDGEVEQKGEYSEQQPVTEEESALFDAAVDGYQMLHATAVTVGSRQVKAGTEYRFEAENQSPDGQKRPVVVYVTKENDTEKPFFTLVDWE